MRSILAFIFDRKPLLLYLFQVVPYEALEKHEMMCSYQRVRCNGCQVEMLQKDVMEHQSWCSAVVAKCDECKMIYKRAEIATQHSDLMCLKKQLRNLQQKSQHEIQQLKEQLHQVQSKEVFRKISLFILL